MSVGFAVVLLDLYVELCLFVVLLNGSDVRFVDQTYHCLVYLFSKIDTIRGYFSSTSIKFKGPECWERVGKG